MTKSIREDWLIEAEKKQRGAWSVDAALSLADNFTEDCCEGIEIPGWALALRALAGRVRLTSELLSNSYTNLENS